MRYNEGKTLHRNASTRVECAKSLVEYIALSLVDDPSSVRVTQERAGSRIRLGLHVAPEDMGRVIGKGGRVANSIRQLLRVSSAKDGRQITLDVVEPN